MTAELKDFITNTPKTELHLHIEGTFEPELMFEMAERNGVELTYATVDELREAYNFSCLQDFLDLYYAGAGVLIHEQDFYDLTMAYFQKCVENKVVHAEIMFDPQTHTERGIAFDTVIKGIRAACEQAEREFGISSLLIMSYLRHLSEEEAFKTLKQSLPYKSWIKAVGLDSSEKGNPPSKFKNVFETSVKEGYIPLAHAGEEGPAEYVWDALNNLKIQRIDHGNNALEDDELVKYLVEKEIALTVCPLSNTCLQVVDDLKQHPLKKMLDLGLKVTINSDDPAYFGGQINENFIQTAEALNLSKHDVKTLIVNSFQYSLLPENDKIKWVNKVEAL